MAPKTGTELNVELSKNAFQKKPPYSPQKPVQYNWHSTLSQLAILKDSSSIQISTLYNYLSNIENWITLIIKLFNKLNSMSHTKQVIF